MWTTQTITSTPPTTATGSHRNRVCRHAWRNGAPGGTGTRRRVTSNCSRCNPSDKKHSVPYHVIRQRNPCATTLSSTKVNQAGGVDGWTTWRNIALAEKSNRRFSERPANGGRVSGAPHPDLRQRRGLARLTKCFWRKAYHTHWMLVRNLHGWLPKGTASLG